MSGHLHFELCKGKTSYYACLKKEVFALHNTNSNSLLLAFKPKGSSKPCYFTPTKCQFSTTQYINRACRIVNGSPYAVVNILSIWNYFIWLGTLSLQVMVTHWKFKTAHTSSKAPSSLNGSSISVYFHLYCNKRQKVYMIWREIGVSSLLEMA